MTVPPLPVFTKSANHACGYAYYSMSPVLILWLVCLGQPKYIATEYFFPSLRRQSTGSREEGLHASARVPRAFAPSPPPPVRSTSVDATRV